MKRKDCELEPRILAALEASGISDNVRQHVTECEVCRDAVVVNDWMARLASFPVEEAALPNPTVILLKAQLLQQSSTLGALAQAMSWGQAIAFGVLAACWGVLLTWKWSAIEAFANAVQTSGMLLTALSGAASQMPLLLTIVVLSCATVAMAFQSVLFED